MKRLLYAVFLLLIIFMVISACATPAPQMTRDFEATEESVATKEVEAEMTREPSPPTPAPTGAAPAVGRALPASNHGSNRLIIKNAEMEIEVPETDQALDLISQMVADVDGYIVSSRIWYVEYQNETYKQASLTMGVPVDQFEVAMRRLRGIAIRVVDETASGQDVTDEYVDLESRLRNLEATRDRIREFLDEADNVEEALKVNEQLSAVEDEIEQVQGRMNYLFDRASYSTITVMLTPDFSAIPTLTPTPTLTPSPTPTLVAYHPVAVVQEASYTLMQVLRGLLTFLIWVIILLGPFAVVIAVVWIVVNRFSRNRSATSVKASKDGEDDPAAD